MNIIIRQEEVKDYESTEKVVELAFTTLEHSYRSEHHLVAPIKNSNFFVPELSLVAMDKDKESIVGILFYLK